MDRIPGRRHLGLPILAASCLAAAGVSAQAPVTGPAREAADAYLSYTRAVAIAAAFDDILPHLSREALAAIGETPNAADAAEVLEMVKLFMPAEIVVVDARQEDGAVELRTRGVSDGSAATGAVRMVREDGAWKVGRESWRAADGAP